MKPLLYKNSRAGSALLIVLFVVMVVTLLSLGFVVPSDRELACAHNLATRMQMDYLADSALTHAKALITNPQDVDTSSVGYWQGGWEFQIAGNNDYYDVAIVRATAGATNRCTYDITCQAYRKDGANKIAQSSLAAQLRIDPYIALWIGSGSTIFNGFTVNGDVYCGGNIDNSGYIAGDVFANGSIGNSGTIIGQTSFAASSPVNLPGLVAVDFNSSYYIDSTQYFAGNISLEELEDVNLVPTAENPAGIYYRNGNLTLRGNVIVNGTLAVGNVLKMDVNCTLTIIPLKNFPALIVDNGLQFENDNQTLNITGFAQVGGDIDMKSMTGGRITVLGALFILSNGVINPGADCSVEVTAAPVLSSLKYQPNSSTVLKWSPVGGAFFKYIERN